MSNFLDWAVHPETGKTEQAEWLDDYFGRHLYGVRFGDGKVFPEGSIRTPGKAPMTNEFLQEVARTFSGQDPRPCRCCKQDWTPSGWNFYGLCNECFPRWNAVRVKLPAPDVKYSVTPATGYYSSCDQWIADGCPDKPEEPFQIHFES